MFELAECALGRRTCDLKIENVSIVDVYGGEVFGGNICIRSGRIASLHDCEAKRVVDGRGMYAVPAFFDAHMHVEPTALMPWELARILVPRGTLELMMDPHEVGNVAGVEGIRFLVNLFEGVPLRPLVQVPSRVPSAPGLETTAFTLGPEGVAELLREPWAVSLGELNYQNALSGKEEYLTKIREAHRLRKVVNGHAPEVLPPVADAYASLGIADDHESVEPEEALEKIRRGMGILVREGTTERNLEVLIKGLLGSIRDFRHLMFCTDDKHPTDIVEEGHIDHCVRRSIELGVDPVTAIQMATVNTAMHFRLDLELGAIAPHRLADILLLEDLEGFSISTVVFEGKVVFRNGKLLWKPEPKGIPEKFLHTVHVGRGLRNEDLLVRAEGSRALVRVIGVIEGPIVNRELLHWLPIVDGHVRADPEMGINHIAVLERHGRGGGVGKGFVSGFSLKEGAIASTVAHDHHNLVVVGADSGDMLVAARELERVGGGFTVARGGRILETLELPFLGLMSLERYEVVLEGLERVNEAARSLGCGMRAPFMQLEFVSLPTVPDLGITDRGLVDARRFEIVDPVVEVE